VSLSALQTRSASELKNKTKTTQFVCSARTENECALAGKLFANFNERTFSRRQTPCRAVRHSNVSRRFD